MTARFLRLVPLVSSRCISTCYWNYNKSSHICTSAPFSVFDFVFSEHHVFRLNRWGPGSEALIDPFLFCPSLCRVLDHFCSRYRLTTEKTQQRKNLGSLLMCVCRSRLCSLVLRNFFLWNTFTEQQTERIGWCCWCGKKRLLLTGFLTQSWVMGNLSFTHSNTQNLSRCFGFLTSWAGGNCSLLFSDSRFCQRFSPASR